MLLADGFVLLWVGVVFIVGLLGFVVVLLASAARALRFVFRVLTGGAWRERPRRSPRRTGWGRLCGNSRCGHVNPDGARYCARCGRPLNAGFDDERYG